MKFIGWILMICGAVGLISVDESSNGEWVLPACCLGAGAVLYVVGRILDAVLDEDDY